MKVIRLLYSQNPLVVYEYHSVYVSALTLLMLFRHNEVSVMREKAEALIPALLRGAKLKLLY